MTQRSIEIVVGRLATDEEFRAHFRRDPHQALVELLESGTHLTAIEIAALVATDPMVWDHASRALDPRLVKASLRSTTD